MRLWSHGGASRTGFLDDNYLPDLSEVCGTVGPLALRNNDVGQLDSGDRGALHYALYPFEGR